MVSWTVRRNWRRCIEGACDIPRYVYSIFGVIRDRRNEKVEDSMIDTEELFKHGFDEFEVQSYPKGTYLTLKCRDYMTSSDLQVALMHARKIAKNKSYRTFMKIKDSIGYKVLEVQDIIEITINETRIHHTENSYIRGQVLNILSK